MITCEDVADLLFELAAAAVSLDQKSAVDEHLVGCTACAAFVESYHHTIDLARRLPPQALPSGLQAKLFQLIASPP